MREKAIDVLVIDDSALVRQLMMSLLGVVPGFTVRTAADPLIGFLKIERQRPDVIVLDLEMPRMDGLTFLRKIMTENPIPVVVCSSIAERGSEAAIRALQLGAVEVIAKPQHTAAGSPRWREMLIDAVIAASSANLHRHRVSPAQRLRSVGRLTSGESVVLMAASTGGTEAIGHVLQEFPVDAPATVIVQHMPERFTAAFARRLDESCAIHVREARDGDVLEAGTALVAPGNRHVMVVRGRPGQLSVLLNDAEPVNRHRPSADVLFTSAAHVAGSSAVGVLLTGMGADGAKGLLALREGGAVTIAQDESTSVVFGMPRAAIQIGAAVHIRGLHEIAATILGAAAAMRRRARAADRPEIA